MLVELLLFGALLFLLWKSFKKPPGLPPGRWGLPLVGYIPFTTKSMEEQVMDLHKQHGSIVLWRMGIQKMVFLNDYKLTKEAFSRPEIMERPDWEAFKVFGGSSAGIVFINGDHWHNNRRFTLRQLRNLGMGKSEMVEAIQHQALNLRKAISKEAGRPAEIPQQLFVATMNVIWQMVASVQFDVEEKRCQEFLKFMNDIVLLANGVAILDFMPWLQNIIPNSILNRFTKYHEVMLVKDKFMAYFFEEIEKHRSTLDPDNPRDLTDGYLLDMEEKKDDPNTTCSDSDLAYLISNLFIAGTETTALTFKWLCCYLAAHPNIQHKIQAEIDTMLPRGTLPTLAEKSRMPYMEAVISEVLRVSSLSNFGVQLLASTDTQLGGYTIPKGTILSMSTTSIQHNKSYWDRPEKFLPDRWLDENGKFTMKKEGFLPFGVGKRSCVGESLARMELFIMTAIVFQDFSISPPPGKTIDLSPDLRGFFFRKPKFNEFIFTERV